MYRYVKRIALRSEIEDDIKDAIADPQPQLVGNVNVSQLGSLKSGRTRRHQS
jgi:hypothetical protein